MPANQHKNILIVAKEPNDIDILTEALAGNYAVLATDQYHRAFHRVRQEAPDLIIIDVERSDQEGIALCEEIKEAAATRDIPVLLMTSLTGHEEIIMGLQAGANDYITKPMCLPSIIARVASHLRAREDYSELDHNDLLMLLELSETISVTRNPNAILRLIVNKISQVLDVARCSIISCPNADSLTVKASSDLDKHREIELELDRYPEIRKSLETKEPVIINDIQNDPIMLPARQYITSLDYNSVIVFPLIKKESVIGTFFLRTAARARDGISSRVYKLCQLVANIAANALENAILFESVKSAQEFFEAMAIQDELTQIFNRRHFYQCLAEEFSRAQRYHLPLSLIFFDVDDFKRINDTYGHIQGDQVLVRIGAILKHAARHNDLPARFGGDEFAMILPNTTSVGAYELANRLGALIKEASFENLPRERLTTSIGVATYVDNNIDNVDQLVKQADDAMYRSKAQGKGRVIRA